MLTLVLSICYWLNPHRKTLGMVAMILSIIGFFADLYAVGALAILDLIVFAVNLGLYMRNK